MQWSMLIVKFDWDCWAMVGSLFSRVSVLKVWERKRQFPALLTRHYAKIFICSLTEISTKQATSHLQKFSCATSHSMSRQARVHAKSSGQYFDCKCILFPLVGDVFFHGFLVRRWDEQTSHQIIDLLSVIEEILSVKFAIAFEERISSPLDQWNH